MLCNFLVRMLQYFLKKSFFDHENIKKLTSKFAYLWQFGFFFSAVPTAQNSPELNICFIDSCIQWSQVLYLGITTWPHSPPLNFLTLRRPCSLSFFPSHMQLAKHISRHREVQGSNAVLTRFERIIVAHFVLVTWHGGHKDLSQKYMEESR